MKKCCSYLKSSIGKKQVVAATGLCLILFVIGHLAGNLFIFLGPEAFNSYAKKLAGLRPGLYVVEAGLAAIFFIHMWFTALVVHDNIRARPVRYLLEKSTEKGSLAMRLMPWTGTIIVVFVVWHLLDFTFTNHHGLKSMIHNKDYGLYGLVFNSFADPIHSLFYILAMVALGFHLSHAIQSVVQTFGFNHAAMKSTIQKLSNLIGAGIAIAFSSIPIYIFLMKMTGACCRLF